MFGKIHSFRAKLLLLLLGTALISQVIVFIVVLLATNDNIKRQTTAELSRGGDVFIALLDLRARLLRGSVEVLSADFGFKSAVASQDQQTIRSALLNHGRRINADIMSVVSLDGLITARVVADEKLGPDQKPQPFPHPKLLQLADKTGTMAIAAMLDGAPYQLVIAPVSAPRRIAWVVIGFAIDAPLAFNLKALSGLEVSFIGRDADGRQFQASTLPSSVTRPDGANELDTVTTEGDYFTLARTLGDDAGQVQAILQTSISEAMQLYTALRTRLLLIGVLTFLLALLGSGLLAGRVSKPVALLASAAARIRRGDYNQTIATAGNDEFSLLAQTFDEMQTGIQKREHRIIHQAYHDGLTGLPNRALARDRLQTALARAQRHDSQLTLLLLDVDRFKEINDSLGHRAGDEVLRQVAKRLRTRLREMDLVARLGSDEFLMLLEDTSLEQAQRLTETLLATLQRPLSVQGVDLTLNASIGLASWPAHGREVNDLLRRVNIALSEAKQSRSGVCVYRDGQDEQHLRQIELMADLPRAVASNELMIYFQPKVDLHSYQVISVEALVRWHHPKHGFIPPDDFILPAERTGNTRLITNWVLEAACQQYQTWQQQGIELILAVNLSAADLLESDLPDYVQNCLTRHSMPPEWLTLEVTESALMRDPKQAITILNRLKSLGVRLSIDDFGTGYSSLSQLKCLPVDELKIDKSFVLELSENSDDAVIVRSTIDIGHNLGLKVIAEGVENQESVRLLQSYRCDIAQGYLFSKPLPAAEFGLWLDDFVAASTQRDKPQTA